MVPERQTIPDSAATRDDGVGSSDKWKTHAKRLHLAPVKSPASYLWRVKNSKVTWSHPNRWTYA